jgi:transposase InsO family protein
LIDDHNPNIDENPMALMSKGFGSSFGNRKTPTFMDSGASDTMFVSKESFIEYAETTPRTGDSAKAKDGDFAIVGEGKVVQRYLVDGREKSITYTRALHTPTLNANLISVSAFDMAGMTITFGGGRGVVRKPDGTIVLTSRCQKGMYLVEPLGDSPAGESSPPLALLSLAKPTTLEQWHRRFAHCDPSTIQDMAKNTLVDDLNISQTTIRGKCEDCVLGRQTRRPFDDKTEVNLEPLELVAFDLWGPSRTQSAGGKEYFMPIVDAGTSYKYGAYLPDKADVSTIAAFDKFRTTAESLTGRKVRRLRTDRAFESAAWEEYCQKHGIIHEFTAPYSSAQNGLAERAIRTTIDDVRTLLQDSGLGHSYWAEAAAFSVDTRNLIPSRRHPGKVPIEMFTGKRQSVSHLRVFGSKCWAKIPTVNGAQVTGGSKLDARGVECRLLGYASGGGNYKVQDISSRRVFVSRDVIFEEGVPHRTSPAVGEQIPLFDTLEILDKDNTTGVEPQKFTSDEPQRHEDHSTGEITETSNSQSSTDDPDRVDIPVNTDSTIPRRSNRVRQPSNAINESREYQQRESTSRREGDEWATGQQRSQASLVFSQDDKDIEDYIACLTETKASHSIPRSYHHAMASDPDRWMVPMQVEMDTLKRKHTWDLVKAPPGANIMDSMWVYDIKWDGEGNRIKDKARLVGKGYTQQLGIDYNETWAGVTRLESVRMTAAIAAKHDLKLWRIDYVGAYLNSLTKEDIYMKQPEGFVEPGLEDHVCKLVHTIYGTMQGAHDWYETLKDTYDELGYITSRADPCVRYKRESGEYTITDTYTDDVFGASTTDKEIKRRKDEMGRKWEIKDVGETEYFLGMRVQQDLEKGIIRLTQRPYWEHVVNRFDLAYVPLRNTPLPVGIVLDSNMSPRTDSEKQQMKDKPYRAVLGSVMWGQLATRPDLSFSVSLLARFQSNPGIEHWNALIHVMGYIKNTLDYGLTYLRDEEITPMAFVDADYGGCRDTRRSTSGYVFTMAGGPVAWSSKRQSTVALSTVEAEYVAMSRCAQQMIWMQAWLDEVTVEHTKPGIIKGDSRGAIALTKNTKDHGKVKHIDIRHHFIRELVQSQAISLEQIPSAENAADMFTKPLSRDNHHRLLQALNIG